MYLPWHTSADIMDDCIIILYCPVTPTPETLLTYCVIHAESLRLSQSTRRRGNQWFSYIIIGVMHLKVCCTNTLSEMGNSMQMQTIHTYVRVVRHIKSGPGLLSTGGQSIQIRQYKTWFMRLHNKLHTAMWRALLLLDTTFYLVAKKPTFMCCICVHATHKQPVLSAAQFVTTLIIGDDRSRT